MSLPTGMCDPRLSSSPFSDSEIQFIGHRHALRVAQSYINAVCGSHAKKTSLFIVCAADAVRDDEESAYTDDMKDPWGDITDLSSWESIHSFQVTFLYVIHVRP